jgi:hypothetical protein
LGAAPTRGSSRAPADFAARVIGPLETSLVPAVELAPFPSRRSAPGRPRPSSPPAPLRSAPPHGLGEGGGRADDGPAGAPEPQWFVCGRPEAAKPLRRCGSEPQREGGRIRACNSPEATRGSRRPQIRWLARFFSDFSGCISSYNSIAVLSKSIVSPSSTFVVECLSLSSNVHHYPLSMSMP